MRLFFILPWFFLMQQHVDAQRAAVTASPLDAVEISARPWVRWWWFADVIDSTDTRAQLSWLKENGFGGVEIAWVYPLHGDSLKKRDPWLSEQWSAAVAAAARQCDELGLGMDMTFGTLWPFGDSRVPVEDGAVVYGEDSSSATMRYTWEHPRRGRVVNHLDSAALTRYANRLFTAMNPAMRNVARGLFCDSWEVRTRKLWTAGFAEQFRNEYGYDIEALMDSLYLPGHERVYYDYMSLISRLVIEQFYTHFTTLAHQRGAYTRVQCAGAPADILEAYRRVDIPETEAILFEPGFARIAASASALDGKPFTSSESFTCLYGWKGWPGPGPRQGEEQSWDIVLLADALFAHGVNHIIWHGMPYNPPGRNEMFYASVHVAPDGALAPALPSLNTYFSEVSSYMRRGRTYSDAAVYLPLEDAWMDVELPDSLKYPWAWGEYELRYTRPPEALKGRHPLWVNAEALRQAEVRQGRMYCGDAVFNSLVVDVRWLEFSTLLEVRRLAAQGLAVALLREPAQPGTRVHDQYAEVLSQLLALPTVRRTLEQLPGEPLVSGSDLPDFWCRVDDDGYYLFLAHPAARDLRYPLRHGQGLEAMHEMRELMLSWGRFWMPVVIDFPAGQSVLLKLGNNGSVEHIPLPPVLATGY
jgi:hypothetical protein